MVIATVMAKAIINIIIRKIDITLSILDIRIIRIHAPIRVWPVGL
jgi:hypothetical protein